jgi:hypothetical protein
MIRVISRLVNKEHLDSIDIGVDENCVMQYLNNFPGEFINEREIARRADGKERFLADPYWAHNALYELTDMKLLETDGEGRYRLVNHQPKAASPGAKFMDPKLRAILEQSGRKFDLSKYA